MNPRHPLFALPTAPPSAQSPTATFLRAQARQVRAQLAALAALADSFDAQADVLDAAPAAPADSPLLTPSECASALGLSIATLNRRVNEGTIPFVQIGDSRRYELAAVRAVLEVSTVSAPRTKALPPAPDSGPELLADAAPAAVPAGVRRVSVGGKRGAR